MSETCVVDYLKECSAALPVMAAGVLKKILYAQLGVVGHYLLPQTVTKFANAVQQVGHALLSKRREILNACNDQTLTIQCTCRMIYLL